jgi:hypothetical protein
MNLYGQRSPLHLKELKKWMKWNQCPDLALPAEALQFRCRFTEIIAQDHGLTHDAYQNLLHLDAVIHEISWLVLSRRIRTIESAQRLVRQVIKN